MRDSGRPPYHSEHTRLEYVSRITITRSMRSWRGVLFYPSACLPVLCCPPPLRCMRRLVLTPTHLHLGTHARTHARGPLEPAVCRWTPSHVAGSIAKSRTVGVQAKQSKAKTDRSGAHAGGAFCTYASLLHGRSALAKYVHEVYVVSTRLPPLDLHLAVLRQMHVRNGKQDAGRKGGRLCFSCVSM